MKMVVLEATPAQWLYQKSWSASQSYNDNLMAAVTLTVIM